MPLSSRDLWGALRGSCNEPQCDCRRYVVVCSADGSAPNAIRCDYCNHVPRVHERITDLGGPEQDSGVPEVPQHIPQPISFQGNKSQETVLANVPQLSTQPGCSKDGLPWVEDHPPSDISELLPGTEGQLDIACSAAGGAQGIPPSTALHESVNKVREPSKGSKEFRDWLLANMPEFSECVQPILRGKALSDRSQQKLSRQLRVELTLFLDEHNLITSGNKGERRSMYKALGDALALKYPLLLWDEQKPDSQLSDTKIRAYSLFIRRLSVARKVQRHRRMKNAALATDSMPAPALTKENVVAKLKALRSVDVTTVALDAARIRGPL